MSEAFSPLELAVNRAVLRLSAHEIGSEEYLATISSLEKLHKMKEAEKPSSISKDTMLVVAANILGIILIISHERVNVVSTRAIGLLLKP